MSRRIVILGMGMSGVRHAENLDRIVGDAELWTMNDGYLVYSAKPAMHFELHDIGYLVGEFKPRSPFRGYNHFVELDKLGCPVVVCQALPVVRQQTNYPVDAVRAKFGGGLYFDGTPSLILAAALAEPGVTRIDTYGIDTLDDQHTCQRASWAWWCSKADSLGIELGGTALDWRKLPSKDYALRGLYATMTQET